MITKQMKAGLGDPDGLREILKPLTARYNWFATSEAALREPVDFLMRVMDLGTLEDICYVEDQVDRIVFLKAIETARVGDFRPRSWSFWHYRLRLVNPSEPVPSAPAGRRYDV